MSALATALLECSKEELVEMILEQRETGAATQLLAVFHEALIFRDEEIQRLKTNQVSLEECLDNLTRRLRPPDDPEPEARQWAFLLFGQLGDEQTVKDWMQMFLGWNRRLANLGHRLRLERIEGWIEEFLDGDAEET